MKPGYRVTVDGKDITPVIDGRLIDLTITDKRGMESDEVSLSLSDHDGRLELPRKGALITVAIGFDGRLIDKGSYTADEIGHDGPPDKLTIRARAADMRNELKAQKSRSFHDTTLGAIFAQIASDNGLKPALDAGLRIKCSRCKTMNYLRTESPQPERHERLSGDAHEHFKDRPASGRLPGPSGKFAG